MSLSFDLKRYLRGFVLLAIATAVFSLVNIAISTIPDTIVVGGDLGELCDNATGVATPTPTPTPTPSNITNINFYDPFNTLGSQYWINLTHAWTVTGGYVRTTVSDSSYDNAIYYVVDFVEHLHDTVQISTRVRVEASPGYNMLVRYCVFLATVDLSVRVLGCIEIYNAANAHYYVYARVRTYSGGSVVLLRSITIESDSYSTVIPGTRDLTLTVTKINETHAMINVSGTTRTGASFSLSPVTVRLDWGSLGYFGLHMTRAYGNEGFDYIDVWITSQYATETVYYNVNFPPPLPTITVTTTVTERIGGLGGDILVLPVGSFVRVLSFAVYIVYIVRTIKHFTP
ncbi:MAG: hypothetical protein ACO2OR_04550, partial [Desulfurococcaceae archaeon]